MTGLNTSGGQPARRGRAERGADDGRDDHRHRGAHVGRRLAGVGRRGGGRAQDARDLVRREHLDRCGRREGQEQRRQLQQPAAAADGVDPAGEPGRQAQQHDRPEVGQGERVHAYCQDSTIAKTSSSRWATASGRAESSGTWWPGMFECGIQIVRMPDLLRPGDVVPQPVAHVDGLLGAARRGRRGSSGRRPHAAWPPASRSCRRPRRCTRRGRRARTPPSWWAAVHIVLLSTPTM